MPEGSSRYRRRGTGRRRSAERRPRRGRVHTGRAAAGGGGRNRRPSGSRYKGRPEGDYDHIPSFISKYFPLFESLVLLILDSSRWFRAFRGYAKEEFRYRSRLFVLSIVYLVCASAFLFGAVGAFIAAFFYLFKDLTGSATGAAFIMLLVTLILAGLLMYLMAVSFGKMLAFDRYQERDEFDDYLERETEDDADDDYGDDFDDDLHDGIRP